MSLGSEIAFQSSEVDPGLATRLMAVVSELEQKIHFLEKEVVNINNKVAKRGYVSNLTGKFYLMNASHQTVPVVIARSTL